MPLLPKDLLDELVWLIIQYNWLDWAADTISMGSTWRADIANMSDVEFEPDDNDK